MPSGLVGKVKALGQLKELASYGPRYGKKALFREVVVDPPDLTRLPVLTTWPGDGGPFITLPIVVTKDRQGRQNAGMYRLQVYDGQHDRHAHGTSTTTARPTSARRATGSRWPSRSAPTRRSPTPPPRRCRPASDEFMFAGFLRGEPVEMAQCATVDLEVPADAEIVLEGYVEQGETRARGAVRRPHRLLLAGRPVPGLPPRP